VTSFEYVHVFGVLM